MFTPRDHVANALARLPHMYRGSDPEHETNTQKVLRALLAPAAALEQAMQDVLFQTITENAEGAQLDEIGALVGRAREGESDDDIYRRYVRAQIAANKSDGLIEDILTIAVLVVGDDTVTFINHNDGVAAFRLQVVGPIADAVADVLFELVALGTADGVRPVVESSATDTDDLYQLDVGPGLDVGHLADARG